MSKKYSTFNFYFKKIMNYCNKLKYIQEQYIYLDWIINQLIHIESDSDLECIYKGRTLSKLDKALMESSFWGKIEREKSFLHEKLVFQKTEGIIEKFSTFDFNFEKLMDYCNDLKSTEDKILYLFWINKEYKNSRDDKINTTYIDSLTDKSELGADDAFIKIINEQINYFKEIREIEITESQNSEPTSTKIEEVNSDKLNKDTFNHSPDYRSVSLRGETFTLTSKQAEVIQTLHEAYIDGTPEIGQDYILEKLSLKNSRLIDIFRSTKGSWKKLIAKGGKKGTIRINI